MLTIKVQIDKEVNELTNKELLALDWDSLREEDFIKLRDDQIPYCPSNEVMEFYYLTEIDPKLLVHSFIAELKLSATRYEIPFKLMRFIHERISCDEKMVPYLKYIVDAVERYNYTKRINRLVKTLIRQNMCSINDMNLSFENIVDDELLYYYSVSADDWFEFCNTTNFLHYIVENFGQFLDAFCLPVYNDQLVKLGFFRIPDFDMKHVSRIYQSHSIEYTIKQKYGEALIPWDTLVQDYHDRTISSDILKYSWDHAMSEQQHSIIASTNFFKEGYPLNWSKDEIED